jgi:MSHA biogenesis protein MshO
MPIAIATKLKKGFTLVELVTSIVLLSIVFSVVSHIIAVPMAAYSYAVDNLELSDISASAMTFLSREIKSAVPNSVRVNSTGTAIEFFPIVAGARYRTATAPTSLNILRFDTTNTTFNLLAPYDYFLPADASGPYRLLIYNTGAYDYTDGVLDYNLPMAGLNVYNPNVYTGTGDIPIQNTHVITPNTTTVTFMDGGLSETTVTLSDAFQFALESPQQRIYVVNTPVSYICDITPGSTTTTGTLTRFHTYEEAATQPTSASDAVFAPGTVSSALLLNHLSSCEFIYEPGTAKRSGIVIFKFSVGSTNGNTAYFIQQIQVHNAP